jgi:hypothetical protein
MNTKIFAVHQYFQVRTNIDIYVNITIFIITKNIQKFFNSIDIENIFF